MEKLATDVEEQIALLESRGMTIRDKEKLKRRIPERLTARMNSKRALLSIMPSGFIISIMTSATFF